MAFAVKNLVAGRMGENYELHSQHLNPALVDVLRITGFDKVYVRAEGSYLYDEGSTSSPRRFRVLESLGRTRRAFSHPKF